MAGFNYKDNIFKKAQYLFAILFDKNRKASLTDYAFKTSLLKNENSVRVLLVWAFFAANVLSIIFFLLLIYIYFGGYEPDLMDEFLLALLELMALVVYVVLLPGSWWLFFVELEPGGDIKSIICPHCLETVNTELDSPVEQMWCPTCGKVETMSSGMLSMCRNCGNVQPAIECPHCGKAIFTADEYNYDELKTKQYKKLREALYDRR